MPGKGTKKEEKDKERDMRKNVDKKPALKV